MRARDHLVNALHLRKIDAAVRFHFWWRMTGTRRAEARRDEQRRRLADRSHHRREKPISAIQWRRWMFG